MVEDIKKSDNLRRGIVERAELSKDFDILAAWEEVEKLEESITKRIKTARMHHEGATGGLSDTFAEAD